MQLEPMLLIISSEGILSLALQLSSLNCLQVLNLNYIHVDDAGAEVLFANLAHLTALKQLSLATKRHSTRINHQGMVASAAHITALTAL